MAIAGGVVSEGSLLIGILVTAGAAGSGVVTGLAGVATGAVGAGFGVGVGAGSAATGAVGSTTGSDGVDSVDAGGVISAPSAAKASARFGPTSLAGVAVSGV